ncbi:MULTISPECIES: hypothetical protein [Pacificimonas]|nr:MULTISPECIES: hypothetical protein [Pacificimonas]MBZ6379816.1 hypothetical protein [Pacificimonas aurantium]
MTNSNYAAMFAAAALFAMPQQAGALMLEDVAGGTAALTSSVTAVTAGEQLCQVLQYGPAHHNAPRRAFRMCEEDTQHLSSRKDDCCKLIDGPRRMFGRTVR